MPPGQAQKGRAAEQGQHGNRTGEVIGRADLISPYDFPRYAVVDDRIVVVEAESDKILQLIRIFTALAN